jgi:hypothetical protein
MYFYLCSLVETSLLHTHIVVIFLSVISWVLMSWELLLMFSSHPEFFLKMVQRSGVSFMFLSFSYHLYLVHSVVFCACFLYIRNCMYGIEILMSDTFAKINPTDPLRLAQQVVRRKMKLIRCFCFYYKRYSER